MSKLRAWTIKLVIFMLGLSLTTLVWAQASDFTLSQQQQIKNIVHDYLVTNPQVLIEAAQALQHKQQIDAQKKLQTAIIAYASRLFQSPYDPSIGNPRAQVNIVEFIDYNCPVCRRVIPVAAHVQATDAEVRLIFKELPTFGPISVIASRAALAANKQGKYLQFHVALLGASLPLDVKKIFLAAKRAGLNVSQLQTDMNSAAVLQELKEDSELAGALGIQGPPAFVVATNPVLNPQIPIASFLIIGAADEKIFRNVIQQAKPKAVTQ